MPLRLEPWTDDDLGLLRRQNAPELMTFLGGPEPDEKVLERHARYLEGRRTGASSMFRIATDEHPEGIGTIGYWPHEWLGEPRLEAGWTLLGEHQGHGYATAALLLLFAHAREHSDRHWMHAFPRTDHLASNAICRKAGMTLLGEVPFEYPEGNPIVSNDWAYAL
jgi:RimJ/RimL family protein N-acetyltransferase